MERQVGDLDLVRRNGLPQNLRILVAEMPRMTWDTHPAFGGLAAFWLDRHLEFRSLLQRILDNADRALAMELDPAEHAARLSRLGSTLLQSLHGHHQIEDVHYFPLMARMEPRVSRGFEILDSDHHALDTLMANFAASANTAIRDHGDAIARLREDVQRFETFVIRHLEDEEDIVVPVILRHGLG